jgi:predicted Zn-ribbon and HTH transcriptional regulator
VGLIPLLTIFIYGKFKRKEVIVLKKVIIIDTKLSSRTYFKCTIFENEDIMNKQTGYKVFSSTRDNIIDTFYLISEYIRNEQCYIIGYDLQKSDINMLLKDMLNVKKEFEMKNKDKNIKYDPQLDKIKNISNCTFFKLLKKTNIRGKTDIINLFDNVKYLITIEENKALLAEYKKFCCLNEKLYYTGNKKNTQVVKTNLYKVSTRKTDLYSFFKSRNKSTVDDNIVSIIKKFKNTGNIDILRNHSSKKDINEKELFVSPQQLSSYGYYDFNVNVNIGSKEEAIKVPAIRFAKNLFGESRKLSETFHKEIGSSKTESTRGIHSYIEDKINYIYKTDKTKSDKITDILIKYWKINDIAKMGFIELLEERLEQTSITKDRKEVQQAKFFLQIELQKAPKEIKNITSLLDLQSNVVYKNASSLIKQINEMKNEKAILNRIATANLKKEILHIILLNQIAKGNVTMDAIRETFGITDIQFKRIVSKSLSEFESISKELSELTDILKKNNIDTTKQESLNFIDRRVQYLNSFFEAGTKGEASMAMALKIATLEISLMQKMPYVKMNVPMINNNIESDSGADVFFEKVRDGKNGILFYGHPFYRGHMYVIIGFDRRFNRKRIREPEFYIYRRIPISIYIKMLEDLIHTKSIGKITHKYILKSTVNVATKIGEKVKSNYSFEKISSYANLATRISKIRNFARTSYGIDVVEKVRTKDIVNYGRESENKKLNDDYAKNLLYKK